MERVEYLHVPLPEDEDEPQYPELGPAGESIGISPDDPRLVTEIVRTDPAADAFATSVTLKVAMNMRGLLARSISVKW